MERLFQNADFLSALCGMAAFAVVVLVWTALIENDPLPGRLKSISQRRSEFEDERRKKASRRAGIQQKTLAKRVVEWLKLSRGKSFDELRLKLKRAGYHSRDAMFTYIFAKLAGLVGVAAIVGFFVLVLKVGHLAPALGLLAAMGGGLVGWMLPGVVVKNMSQKREDVLRRAMPDALDLMVICAEAGLSLDSSFDRVGREIGPTCPELAEEMGLTGVELNFLPDRHKALHGLAERVPLPSVLALVNTLIQTERYGTPLAQALRVLSAEMREDRMMRAEEKAARLPAILTVPMIVFILPPLFVVLIGPAALKVADAMKGAH